MSVLPHMSVGVTPHAELLRHMFIKSIFFLHGILRFHIHHLCIFLNNNFLFRSIITGVRYLYNWPTYCDFKKRCRYYPTGWGKTDTCRSNPMQSVGVIPTLFLKVSAISRINSWRNLPNSLHVSRQPLQFLSQVIIIIFNTTLITFLI